MVWSRVVPGISRDPGMISMRREKIPGIPGIRQISRDPDIDPGIPGFFRKGGLQRNLNPGIPGSDPGCREDLHERGKDPHRGLAPAELAENATKVSGRRRAGNGGKLHREMRLFGCPVR